jgi:hypothetical protein
MSGKITKMQVEDAEFYHYLVGKYGKRVENWGVVKGITNLRKDKGIALLYLKLIFNYCNAGLIQETYKNQAVEEWVGYRKTMKILSPAKDNDDFRFVEWNGCDFSEIKMGSKFVPVDHYTDLNSYMHQVEYVGLNRISSARNPKKRLKNELIPWKNKYLPLL